MTEEYSFIKDIESERILEIEEVEIDGVDIGGQWNRMFLERVITDYTIENKEKITSIPGAESFGWCYTCSQCISVCPIDHVGEYGPLKLVRWVETGMDLLNDLNLYLCTTCANCLRVCPKEVDMMKIMPAVREEALMSGFVPEELEKALEFSARYGNPLGEPARKRIAWIKECDVEVPIIKKVGRKVDWLWFVGDYPAYHLRGKDTAKALARIYHRVGLDFAILGIEEQSDGDSQRLAGEKGLFEMLAEKNLKAFSQYEFGEIVVTGPHALNAILNEYPKVDPDGKYPVRHYTQVLAQYIDKMEFKKELPARVTFHDPCYLGRHNNEYEAPRDLLRAIPGIEVVEMGRCRENGYCCGGGGGGQWIDLSVEFKSERLSDRRVREAVDAGAQILAVSCPYEVSRFEDGVKSTGNEGNLIVRDIAELLDWAMGGDSPAPI
jgi:Fe-S oxidoreductase